MLKQLHHNNDLICRPSDKGGNVIIMDCKEYLIMTMRLLNDAETYEVLETNPTE